jgi:uncharacterized BrkB/YihY/UPF0761 family membrane protein
MMWAVAVDAPGPQPGTPLPPPTTNSGINRARELVDIRWSQLVASRHRKGSIDVAFQVFESDRAKGGGIMAGAVAFRMFVALVPATLVLIIVFGTIADVTGEATQDVARQAGITGVAATTIKTAADASTSSTIVTLALALFALFLASNSLAKTLRVANFLLWDMPLEPLRRSWRAGLTVIGLLGAVSAVTLLIARARLVNGPLGFVSILAGTLAYFGLWVLVSYLLPHRGGIVGLLPGAVLVAVGVEVLHVVTVYYVSRRVETWSARYGGLGVAVVILGWLYLMGRLIVGSAALNVAIWRRFARAPLPPPLPPPMP